MTDFRASQIPIMKARLGSVNLKKLTDKHGSPLLLVDEEGIKNQYQRLIKAMPRVRPHFAIKSCPMPELLKILKSIGASLDVATDGEIEILKKLNYSPDLMIHTHPHKTPKAMKTAFDYGIRTFVVDDLSELEIIKPYKKDVKILLRLSFSSHHAGIDLSYKFGIDPNSSLDTIKTIVNKGYNLAGLSFHVGSQVHTPDAYINALTKTAEIYKETESKLGIKFELLDIGGGLPSRYHEEVHSPEDFAKHINKILDKDFPDTKILSEPGRILINEFVTLVTTVISKTKRGDQEWLFIDDGIYGSFCDMFSEKINYLIYSAKELGGTVANKHYVVAGPTCDSLDVMSTDCLLPETNIGDILLTPNIGAYSYAVATTFNSINRTPVLVI